MASFTDIADKSIRLILLYLKNISLNFYRRLSIGWKYVGIFWQKRRMAKQFRRLGESVYVKLAAGDVNPLLQEEVKDRITSLQSAQENIVSRGGAIEQIREQIKATSYRLTPPAAVPEPESKPDPPVD
jgi:hypothetical protein